MIMSISFLLHIVATIIFLVFINFSNREGVDKALIIENNSLGYYRFFSYISAGILLQPLHNGIKQIFIASKMNEAISTFSYISYGGAYIFAAVILWFIIRIISRSSILLIGYDKKISELIKEDNLSAVLTYSGIVIMSSIALQSLLGELIDLLISKAATPFYY